MPDPKQPALIATPLARDQTIAALQEHFARNHLEMDAFERRVELCERARSQSELNQALLGLPPLEALVAADAGRVTTTIQAMFASATRRGRFRVPTRLRVRAVLGNVELDLSEAELPAQEVVLEVGALFGSVTIIVPEGLAVDCEGNALFGSFDHVATSAASRRDARRLRIVGGARFGSVEIIVKKSAGVLAQLKSGLQGLLSGR